MDESERERLCPGGTPIPLVLAVLGKPDFDGVSGVEQLRKISAMEVQRLAAAKKGVKEEETEEDRDRARQKRQIAYITEDLMRQRVCSRDKTPRLYLDESQRSEMRRLEAEEERLRAELQVAYNLGAAGEHTVEVHQARLKVVQLQYSAMDHMGKNGGDWVAMAKFKEKMGEVDPAVLEHFSEIAKTRQNYSKLARKEGVDRLFDGGGGAGISHAQYAAAGVWPPAPAHGYGQHAMAPPQHPWYGQHAMAPPQHPWSSQHHHQLQQPPQHAQQQAASYSFLPQGMADTPANYKPADWTPQLEHAGPERPETVDLRQRIKNGVFCGFNGHPIVLGNRDLSSAPVSASMIGGAGRAVTSTCFTCGRAGHHGYECPTPRHFFRSGAIDAKGRVTSGTSQ